MTYCYIARYTDVWNRHRESKNTKLYEIDSSTKLFITFELKVIQYEREAQSFYADFSICPPPRVAPSCKLLVWSPWAPKVNLIPLRQELNSLLFLKSQNPQPTLPGMTSFTSLVLFPIWGFILTSENDAYSLRAREYLR